jgi:CDP-glycerol glycerophosphotransferase (TagB/SpsB family)
VLPLLEETGGFLLTSCRRIEKHIQRYYEELGMRLENLGKRYEVIYCQKYGSLARVINPLQIEIMVHPSFSLHYFKGIPNLKHVQVFHGTSDKPFNFHKSLGRYDLIVVPGPKMRDDIVQRGLATPSKIAVIGYPKIDYFLHSSFNRNRFIEKIGLDSSRKTVLYSPTWDDPDGYSSFSRYIITILRTLKDVNLIIKPHPNLLKFRPWQIIKGYLFKRKNAFFYVNNRSILPFMEVSDLLITDISSVSHEYLPFNKPMVFLHPRPGKRIPPEHVWIWQCGDVIEAKDDIPGVVYDNLSHPDKYHKERQRAMKMVFFDFDGKSSVRFREHIFKI